ncbi:MAG: helix-turn-helix transcriptional regulator [Rhodospirillaceae bacterium]|nr:helix-turn-helix transcriptional regulator [Rhodospirillales bacterium]
MTATAKLAENVATRRHSSRGRTASGKPNPVDVHVGARVRLRRTLLGMSQEKLGEALGLTFQQVQKYERGANRVGASRLFDLSRVLDVPVSFFFDDMSGEVEALSPRLISGLSEEPASFEADPLTKRETLELVRAYYRITDPQVRRRVLDLAKALGAVTEG